MPTITINISEQMEAKVVECIRHRRDFRIDGGTISEGSAPVPLKGVLFEFLPEQQSESAED